MPVAPLRKSHLKVCDQGVLSQVVGTPWDLMCGERRETVGDRSTVVRCTFAEWLIFQL